MSSFCPPAVSSELSLWKMLRLLIAPSLCMLKLKLRHSTWYKASVIIINFKFHLMICSIYHEGFNLRLNLHSCFCGSCASEGKESRPMWLLLVLMGNPSSCSPASLSILQWSLSVFHVFTLQPAEVERGQPGHFKTAEVRFKAALNGRRILCRCWTRSGAWE